MSEIVVTVSSVAMKISEIAVLRDAGEPVPAPAEAGSVAIVDPAVA
jgi:hypothetical protein